MSLSKEKPPESSGTCSGTKSPDNDVLDSSPENEIFRIAEEKVGKIPKNLRNVMSICGYTTSAIISTIDSEDIENMEQYMRDLDPTVAPPTKDLYGIYQNCPQKFKFGPGERAFILKIKNAFSPIQNESPVVEETEETNDLVDPVLLNSLSRSVLSWGQNHLIQTEREKFRKIRRCNVCKIGSSFIGDYTCNICEKNVQLSLSSGKWVTTELTKHFLKSHSNCMIMQCQRITKGRICKPRGENSKSEHRSKLRAANKMVDSVVERNQKSIHEFFKIVLHQLTAVIDADEATRSTFEKTDVPKKLTSFLKKLIVLSERNTGSKYRNRYDEEIKKISTYLFCTGGPMVYEILSVNLGLPSKQSIYSCLRNFSYKIVEGKIYADELKNYLEERNLPKVVWISEDATRIVRKVQYDHEDDQIVGMSI
ncbi:hypothetical protein DMENIID0001_010600 [Sergentomyia squamirostris]